MSIVYGLMEQIREFLLNLILHCEAVMGDQQHNVKLGRQLVGNASAVSLQDVAVQNELHDE